MRVETPARHLLSDGGTQKLREQDQDDRERRTYFTYAARNLFENCHSTATTHIAHHRIKCRENITPNHILPCTKNKQKGAHVSMSKCRPHVQGTQLYSKSLPVLLNAQKYITLRKERQRRKFALLTLLLSICRPADGWNRKQSYTCRMTNVWYSTLSNILRKKKQQNKNIFQGILAFNQANTNLLINVQGSRNREALGVLPGRCWCMCKNGAGRVMHH